MALQSVSVYQSVVDGGGHTVYVAVGCCGHYVCGVIAFLFLRSPQASVGVTVKTVVSSFPPPD